MTTHQPDPAMPVVAYIGNFRPEHSTENHVAETLRRMGCAVHQIQEDEQVEWQWLMDGPGTFDLVLWTRTGSLSPPDDVCVAMLERCAAAGVPTVGFHLDRWWGLNREGQVGESAFFRCTHVITADGGHDAEWAAAGVNHTWMPPAVAEFEMGWGRPDPRMACEVAFVGSWNSYHAEWPWRRRMVRLIASRYGNQRFRCWPQPGDEAVRGQQLRNLYASATVVVGDSCLSGGAHHYWSDRIPETLGRGGLLIHPNVDGLLDAGFGGGEHLLLVEPENIEAMFATIDYALGLSPRERTEIQRAGMALVADRHTYRHRMADMFDLLDLDVPR